MKNQSNPRAVDPLLLQEVVRILSAHFASEIKIKSVTFLSNPERRNLVLRIILQSPQNGAPESVIFKQSHLEKDSGDDKEMLGRFAGDWPAYLWNMKGRNIVTHGYNKMHDNELDIDELLVSKLLARQFPQLAELTVTKVKHSGTDNAIFRLGENYAIRLPRVDDAAEQIKKEQTWLSKLGKHLSLMIPVPIKIGNPSEDFPHPWYVYSWIEGIDAYHETPSCLHSTAKDLAVFITELWKINTDGAPAARRGLPVSDQDKEVREAIQALRGTMDTDIITAILEKCVNVPSWNKPSVWLHGDLLPSNLLIQNGKLHAIIDFGLMGIGDPACDLIPAWCLFDANSRATFKEALDIDEETWIRGKARALSIALIIIPYYLKTNPVLVSVARRMIEEIIHDGQ